MKIAIPSNGTTLDAAVDPRFRRCKYFVFVDADTGTFEGIENTQRRNAAQGAGIQAAQTVVNHGAEAVITGHCGPKAFRALTAAGVKIYLGAEGTIRDIVTAFKTVHGKPWMPQMSRDIGYSADDGVQASVRRGIRDEGKG